MIHNTYSFKKSSIIIAAICSLLLCTNSFADDSTNGRFQQSSFTSNLGPTISASNEGLDVSLGFTYEDRDDLDFLIENSSIAYQMDPLGFMGLNESPRPGGTSRLFKWALNEYRFLHRVRDVVDDVEERVENYGEKIKFKGEVVFYEDKSSRLTGGDKRRVGVSLNLKENRTFKSWLFSHKFVPRKFKWRLSADPSDETVGGRFFIGEYLTLEGNVGQNENSSAFLMFRYTF